MGESVSERLVASINASYGVHPGYRAAHAKGVLCAARFEPTPEATSLSRAAHFAGPSVRAHVRFSNGSGNPTIPDGVRDGRGMAVKFYLPGAPTDPHTTEPHTTDPHTTDPHTTDPHTTDPHTTDIVALSLPAFFARTPGDLLAFNEARRVDPATGGPDLAKVGDYLAAHPEAVPAVTAAMTHPIPASYASLTYHGLHAFGFVAVDGTVRFAGFHLVPDGGEVSITDEDAARRRPDFLREELAERLAECPAGFSVQAQLAGTGDALDDPTAPWPDDRTVVELGRLEVVALAFDREHDGDVLVFDPTRVTDGIVLTDDPILHARAGAYGVSVARRTGRDD